VSALGGDATYDPITLGDHLVNRNQLIDLDQTLVKFLYLYVFSLPSMID